MKSVDDVIREYQDFRSRKRLSDQYLEENGCETRKENDWDLVGDYVYGIVFLRDDGVDILIDEIHKLRERMKPKKTFLYEGFHHRACPTCDARVENGQPHCAGCGQALDWSE